MYKNGIVQWLLAVPSALSLVACGGDAGGAFIGGSVTGLGAGQALTLQDNSTDSLVVTTNGPFVFDTGVTNGAAYAVSVSSEPAGQVCTVANGGGIVDSSADPVTTVTVVCLASASVGGTVSGLPAGTSVTLSDNGVLLPIASNGGFAFPGILSPGSSYDVTIAVQPAGHACTIADPSGVVVQNVMAQVLVTCG